MNSITTIGVLIIALFLSGCGAMLDGRIYRVDDGQLLPMKIALSYGQGKMEAYNPATDEHFKGTYTAIRDVDANFVGSSFASAQSSTGYVNAQGFGFGNVRSRKANARAFLVGDKGTTLNINMQIQAGIRPIGYGEGVDNKGNQYHVEF